MAFLVLRVLLVFPTPAGSVGVRSTKGAKALSACSTLENCSESRLTRKPSNLPVVDVVNQYFGQRWTS